MAANTSIKQQCPNCDAKVPIKDESMIGEEITCPKCKQPFVVEDPDDPAPAPVIKKKPDTKGKGSSLDASS